MKNSNFTDPDTPDVKTNALSPDKNIESPVKKVEFVLPALDKK